MEKFARDEVQDMFGIMTGHLHWDQLGVDSYYELESIRNIMESGREMNTKELQRAYNVIQSARFYFNAHVNDPNFPNSFKMDAIRFGFYYKAFITMYPVKNLTNPKNEHGACYIATAVYGSYNNPKVIILRIFRDKYLNTSQLGRQLINFYYKHSPQLALKLIDSKYISVLIRKVLDVFVYVIIAIENRFGKI